MARHALLALAKRIRRRSTTRVADGVFSRAAEVLAAVGRCSVIVGESMPDTMKQQGCRIGCCRQEIWLLPGTFWLLPPRNRLLPAREWLMRAPRLVAAGPHQRLQPERATWIGATDFSSGLRHTSATLMLASGVPAKVAAERLGHADPTLFTNLYSHVTQTMQEDAASKIGDVLFG
jgi:hypothetical protein